MVDAVGVVGHPSIKLRELRNEVGWDFCRLCELVNVEMVEKIRHVRKCGSERRMIFWSGCLRWTENLAPSLCGI